MIPSLSPPAARQRCKTRIICISDTHNQTPKLPHGDILIHAGDLTNQGSYCELKKTVEWLEKADFEAKVVVAGNHDTTLDEPFFHGNKNKWKWPTPQDPASCKKLLTDSPSITYLENSATTIYLTSPKGPRTCFKIFGSPASPGRRGWAFQYWEEADAERLWKRIDEDVDIVVTHTPAQEHCDAAGNDQAGRAGCPVLLQRLSEVRPMLHVCGHIHAARGVDRIRWSPSSAANSLVKSTQHWTDPGAGNKKISLVDLTAKARVPIDNTGRLTRHVVSDSLEGLFGDQPDAVPGSEGPQPGRGEVKSTSSLEDGALLDNEAAEWRKKDGGAVECKWSDVGHSEVDAGLAQEKGTKVNRDRCETVVINAAFLGPRVAGPMTFHKPIVVDVELPVWNFSSAQNVQ